MRRVWWQFRLRTLLITSPILTLLFVAALTSSPYWWRARDHDVAVSNAYIECAVQPRVGRLRPDEAAIYLRNANQADAPCGIPQGAEPEVLAGDNAPVDVAVRPARPTSSTLNRVALARPRSLKVRTESEKTAPRPGDVG